jgi:CheY-like chemotaxis protein
LAIVDDILDLSKIEAGQATIEKCVFDPIRMVEDVVSLMQVRAEDKRLLIQARIENGFPDSIESDPTRLRQILINLVGNAIKFTETGGVTINASCPQFVGGPLTFAVHDTGIGIDDEMIQRIFDPFVQADETTARRFGGTGLGLSICNRFANLLGGEIQVESEIGQGSTFTLSLQCTHQTANVAVHDGATKVRESYKLDRGYRILLAEDGLDNQKLITHVLNRAGAEVVTVDDGRQAVDIVLEREFDLILMDMQMPVMDGYAATKELREQGVTTPIVALTAHVMDGAKTRCLEAGCDDYSSKPINRGNLIGMINHILAGPFSEDAHSKGSDRTDECVDEGVENANTVTTS